MTTQVAHVNVDRCRQVAKAIAAMDVPAPREDVPKLPFSRDEEANFWFLLAAICHQTSPAGLPALEGELAGVHRRGWDYLVHAFLKAATNDRGLLSPKRWEQIDEHAITEVFGNLLSSPKTRAALITDLGKGLATLNWTTINNAHAYCDGYLTNHTPSLLNFLSRFKAFSDPVEKKSVFFLALMQNTQNWKYADEELLPPPVDYHEVRGHLRIGTVKLTNHEVETQIRRGDCVLPSDDISLRLVVKEAIQLIAERVGHSPNALHYLFWNLFRTYCVRDTPLCNGEAFERLPHDYAISVRSAGSTNCPFITFCSSANSKNAINEHRVVTEYY
jgi:hypothetical protein